MWGAPVPANVKEAGALVQRPATAFTETPAIAAFVADLLREFPSIAEDLKRSPWSVMPTPSERFLELDFSSRAKDADLERVFALASQHGLVVYDPDGPSMYLPGVDEPSD